jgi:hypothetical protein
LNLDLKRVLADLDVSYVVVHPALLSDERRSKIVSLIETMAELHGDPAGTTGARKLAQRRVELARQRRQ